MTTIAHPRGHTARPHRRRTGKALRSVLIATAVLATTVGLAQQPASAGVPTGCASRSIAVDDHTLLGARSYTFHMYYRWCWMGSTIGAFSQHHLIDHLDSQFHEVGVIHDDKAWHSYANVPFRASPHGAMHTHVQVEIENSFYGVIHSTFRPYINAQMTAGGGLTWQTGGYSWSQ